MSKFISSANSMIAVVDDASYQLNDALPDCGEHAEVGWFNTESDHAATAAASIKKTTSTKDGLSVISIQLGAATAADQEYNVEGWVKLS